MPEDPQPGAIGFVVFAKCRVECRPRDARDANLVDGPAQVVPGSGRAEPDGIWWRYCTECVDRGGCALYAVELIVSARPGTRASDIDQILWLRGQQPHYKAQPRHRARCTAY